MPLIPHPGAKSDCAYCAGASYVVRRNGEFAVASSCECSETCPTCSDTGWVADGDDWRAPRKRCLCASIQRRIALFNRANIPGRHAGSTFARFDAELHGSLAIASGACKAFVTNWSSEDENLAPVLFGKVGLGKTHLMCATVRELIFQHGIDARFIEFTHLLADLKSSFDQGGGAGAMVNDLVSVDVLAIDELGKGRNTEWEGTVLDELISRRYNSAAPVIATTNYRPARTGFSVPNPADPDRTMPGLIDRVGDRVFSRLFELCKFVPLIGEDYRKNPALRTQPRV